MPAKPDDRPQIYLITPPAFDPQDFAPQLERVLDTAPVACLRLALVADEDSISRAADILREIAHARDIALVIERHAILAQRLGLDGVHVTDSAGLRKLRADLGPDAIIGVGCRGSRHNGISAAEAGADYVCFSPVGESVLDRGERAERELFEWWSEMIEIPVVAEGALTPALVADLAPVTDFLAFGQEIWTQDDPAAALAELLRPLNA